MKRFFNMIEKLINGEMIPLALLLGLVAIISYVHIGQSISLGKYHLQWGINNLLSNYDLFHHSFKEFLFRTSVLHPGNSESEWHTISFLLPLFVFSDLIGGLSLKTICLFTVTGSLIFLSLFYGWIKEFWGKPTALWAAFFLGFSSIFQEIARSGSYDAVSLLIAIGWCFYLFRLGNGEKLMPYFIWGLLTALTWYGYGILRSLTLIALAQVLLSKILKKKQALGLFLLGMMLVLIPGFLIKIWVEGIDLNHYHAPAYTLLIDRESAFGWNFETMVKEVLINVKVFAQRMLGANQLLEPVFINRTHAPFWDHLLLIPLLIGVWQTIKRKEYYPNQLLVILSFFIFLAPCLLTSSKGFEEARRSLLYIIPGYCFIGLGTKEILQWINNFKNVQIKNAINIIFFGIVFIIVIIEFSFVQSYIISSNRDFGMIEFAHQINKIHSVRYIYYLEHSTSNSAHDYPDNHLIKPLDRQSIYRFADESELLRVALMQKGKIDYHVKSGTAPDQVPFLPNTYYVVKSPCVSFEEFDNWCVLNHLKAKTLITSNVQNESSVNPVSPFGFYFVEKTPG